MEIVREVSINSNAFSVDLPKFLSCKRNQGILCRVSSCFSRFSVVLMGMILIICYITVEDYEL